jgi:hypothetical protein
MGIFEVWAMFVASQALHSVYSVDGLLHLIQGVCEFMISKTAELGILSRLCDRHRIVIGMKSSRTMRVVAMQAPRGGCFHG